SAPTAKNALATATPSAPVSSRATIDHVIPSTSVYRGRHYNAARAASAPIFHTLSRNIAMSTPAAPPPSFNLAEHLIARNAPRADRIAYIDDRSRLSYGELAKRIRQFASVVSDCGL